jgi:hypothetical protein
MLCRLAICIGSRVDMLTDGSYVQSTMVRNICHNESQARSFHFERVQRACNHSFSGSPA